MAHTPCPNGHDMWNGNGKPVLWIFRVNFFRDFMKRYPLFRFDSKATCYDFADVIDDFSSYGESIDGWYCEICKGVTLFVDNERYDYVLIDNNPDTTEADLEKWEKYIVLRDHDYPAFQDYCEMKDPIEAIESYDFKYSYWLSPDKKTIIATKKDGTVAFAYQQSNHIEFSPNLEITYGTTSYKDYEEYAGIKDLHVSPGKYVCMKNGRYMIVDQVIKKGKLYVGHEIKEEEGSIIFIRHEEITAVYDRL